MENQISINWNQAQSISKEVSASQSVKKQEAINLFLESSHEMADARDLLYFQEETGKDLIWLLSNGKNISPKLSQPLLLGACLDDLIDIDVYDYSQEDEDEETPDLCLCDENIKVYFMSITADKYIIHVANYFGFGCLFPNDEAIFESLEDCKKINHSEFIQFAKDKNINNQF